MKFTWSYQKASNQLIKKAKLPACSRAYTDLNKDQKTGMTSYVSYRMTYELINKVKLIESVYDTCVFFKGAENKIIIVAVFIDDIMIF